MFLLENAKIRKYVMVREIFSRGNVLLGKWPIRKSALGKCPVRELSGWGSVHWEDVSQGSFLGKVSVGKLSSRETVLQYLVRLPHPLSRDSQDQEMFLAPSADKQSHNYDTECSNHHPSQLL